MRFKPVSLFAKALALLPHPEFVLPSQPYRLSCPLELIMQVRQCGLGLHKLNTSLGELLLLGLASPFRCGRLRYETLPQSLALASVPRQQPSVPLRMMSVRPMAT